MLPETLEEIAVLNLEVISDFSSVQFSSGQSPSWSDSLQPHESQHAQASLSITNSQSSLKLMFIESVKLAYLFKGILPGTQGDI